ncbi:hypothetical protein F5148DRAFT_173662 [Russula earlei]|uniref:Uncharacterized protein n=1 Tax=Russula earlei TaxID=71964 RepID=A0ACC0U7T0_9AGAM|nr:hypothetical protein F5148DRAFT_173662 [Russula earlei]
MELVHSIRAPPPPPNLEDVTVMSKAVLSLAVLNVVCSVRYAFQQQRPCLHSISAQRGVPKAVNLQRDVCTIWLQYPSTVQSQIPDNRGPNSTHFASDGRALDLAMEPSFFSVRDRNEGKAQEKAIVRPRFRPLQCRHGAPNFLFIILSKCLRFETRLGCVSVAKWRHVYRQPACVKTSSCHSSNSIPTEACGFPVFSESGINVLAHSASKDIIFAPMKTRLHSATDEKSITSSGETGGQQKRI